MARLRRCVLHIGTEKTGSTTVQEFLALNRDALRAHGILVPRALTFEPQLASHGKLTAYAVEDDRTDDDMWLRAGGGDPALLRRRIAAELRAELARISPADGDAVLLLSDEHCHSRLLAVSEIARLRDLLAEFADEIRIVVYLRPQHEVAASLYDTALKIGFVDPDILPRFDQAQPAIVGPEYFDYAALLDRWSAVFGEDRMQVRLFGRTELVGGCIVNDFLAFLGCATHGAEFKRDKNVSMDLACQTVLNAFNRAARGRRIERLRDAVLIELDAISTGGGRLPTREEAHAFYARYSAGNERVRERWFPDRPALFAERLDYFPERAATLPGLPASTVRVARRALVRRVGDVGRKVFFFEKKNQKTLSNGAPLAASVTTKN